MKKCPKCGEVKTYSCFSKHNNRVDGLQVNCKSCVKIYDITKYKNNKEKRLRQNRELGANNIEYYRSLKDNLCTDCGVKYHPAAMQFDHVYGTKKHSPSTIARSSRAKLVEELKKCELVCANCHAIRTYNRRKLA